jgi:hypothetical protein
MSGAKCVALSASTLKGDYIMFEKESQPDIIPIKNQKMLEKSLKRLSTLESDGQSVLTRLPQSVNIAQLLAKLETEKSIKKLAHLRDNAEKEEVQRGCANDLLNRAWGLPAQSIMVTNETRTSIDETVVDATNLLVKAQYYISKPVEEWPDDVKEYFGVANSDEERVINA